MIWGAHPYFWVDTHMGIRHGISSGSQPSRSGAGLPGADLSRDTWRLVKRWHRNEGRQQATTKQPTNHNDMVKKIKKKTWGSTCEKTKTTTSWWFQPI